MSGGVSILNFHFQEQLEHPRLASMAANSSRWEKLEALSVEYDEINGELESIYRPNRFSMDVRKACDRMIEDAQW